MSSDAKAPAGSATPPILPTRVPKRGFDFATAIRWVRAKEGKGGLRQALELLWLSVAGGFSPSEYYLLGLFRRPTETSHPRTYISERRSLAFNERLNPRDLLTQNHLANDKLLAGFVFEGAGLPTPRLIGHAATRFRIDSPRTLTTPDEICEFLRRPGSLPCYGKPVHGSRALGTVSIRSVTADGQRLTLGNGTEVPTLALAQEILAWHPDGYLFQELVLNAPPVAALIGPTVGSVRIVTVQTGAGPQVLYASIRIPAPNAMSDAMVGGRSGRAAIDRETGRVLRAQDLFRMSVSDLDTHPETGAAFAGAQLPDWDDAKEITLRGHRVLADQGIIGWDVFLSPRGPLLSEANMNPHHDIYQRAFARGLLNPDLLPLIDAARANVASRRAERKGKA